MGRSIAAVLFFFISFHMLSGEARGLIGREMPPFRVVSGDDKILTRDMILGKVVIFFYETRSSYDINQPFKNILNKLYDIQDEAAKAAIFKLAVIKCTSAFWPFTPIWKSQLVKQSEKRYFTIYGDWDGKMLDDYGLEDDDSNLMIIDKDGIVRYYTHGKISEAEGGKIESLLLALLAQNK